MAGHNFINLYLASVLVLILLKGGNLPDFEQVDFKQLDFKQIKQVKNFL